MSVYNAELYLKEAIESILNQTYKEFEFIIINDGSTDNSLAIIKDYSNHDSRIILINRENKGLIYSLNEGISKAKGKYIARMDADDISLPNRFEEQIKFLENNLDIGVVGSDAIVFHKDDKSIWTTYSDSNRTKAELLFSSPLIHPSVMMRKSIIDKYKLFYKKEYIHAEDLELWIRFANVSKLSNIN
jgi:glycosyltransferase involved in cell wall biosynthesis